MIWAWFRSLFTCERRLYVEQPTNENRGMPLKVTGVNTTRSAPGFESIINRGHYWSFFLRLGHPWFGLNFESSEDDAVAAVRLTIWRLDFSFRWWAKAAL